MFKSFPEVTFHLLVCRCDFRTVREEESLKRDGTTQQLCEASVCRIIGETEVQCECVFDIRSASE